MTLSVAAGASPVESNQLLESTADTQAAPPAGSLGVVVRGTVGLWTPAGPVTDTAALSAVMRSWAADNATASSEARLHSAQQPPHDGDAGNPMATGVVLNVFDFDATLFHTPDYDEGRRCVLPPCVAAAAGQVARSSLTLILGSRSFLCVRACAESLKR